MFKQFFCGEGGGRLKLRRAFRAHPWPDVACASCTFFRTYKRQEKRVRVEIVVCHDGLECSAVNRKRIRRTDKSEYEQ